MRDLKPTPGLWTRRVTNLDDGSRYQCAARWSDGTAYPEWSCSSYAPVPGRETRDMKRSDYDTLERTTRIIVYGQSFLERQDNVKTIHRDGARRRRSRARSARTGPCGCRTPSAKPRAAFAAPRQAFWSVSREVWDGVLNGAAPFVEKAPAGPAAALREDVRGRGGLRRARSFRSGAPAAGPRPDPEGHRRVPRALAGREKILALQSLDHRVDVARDVLADALGQGLDVPLQISWFLAMSYRLVSEMKTSYG